MSNPIFTPAVVAALERLVTAAGAQQVNLHITLNDHDHSWYVSIDSAAPAERFISRDRPQLESAVEDALHWMAFLTWCGQRRLNPADPAIQRASGLNR